ncbi:hypothetical protein BASA60_003206 [Batrachochytrium salamandrivorans]|nr:hypothetical protein BASA60_003206 [Batrachochytrium salamandrivorans]
MYLSRPGHDNPYVPKVFDYFILEDEYIAVMEYFGEDWVNFSRYRKERIRLEVSDARDIVREVVEALIYLKQYNVVHRDIHGKIKLIDFGRSGTLPEWKEEKSFLSKLSNPTINSFGIQS